MKPRRFTEQLMLTALLCTLTLACRSNPGARNIAKAESIAPTVVEQPVTRPPEAPLPRRTVPSPSVAQPKRGIATTAQSLRHCPKPSSKPVIVGIGSSTMASWLGPALKKRLKQHPVTFHKMGIASSGLARPDFYDWPKSIGKLVKRYKPTLFVVAMGTNDFQSMRVGKKWIRFPDPKWFEVYGNRVDQMLNKMSGPNRDRTVIWVGPTAFAKSNSRRYGAAISQIIKDKIDAFAGPAMFIDAFAATSDDKSRALKFMSIPGTKRRVKVHGSDNIHLTHSATKVVMTDPVMALLTECALSKP